VSLIGHSRVSSVRLPEKQPYDWNCTTSPQPGLNGRSVLYPRGKILGGSSSTSKSLCPYRGYIMLTFWTRSDYMVYNTGSKDDWDHIGRITEDPAWTWDAMAHYRGLNQRYVPPNDHHDDVSQKQTISFIHSSILITLPRRTSTSHRHTAVTGWYPSVFLGTHGLSTRELPQPPPNHHLYPTLPSNEI